MGVPHSSSPPKNPRLFSPPSVFLRFSKKIIAADQPPLFFLKSGCGKIRGMMCEKPSKYVNFHLDVPFAGVQKQILSNFQNSSNIFKKFKVLNFFAREPRAYARTRGNSWDLGVDA